MFLTGNTSRSAPKYSVLDGRNGTVISGRDLSSDNKVPQGLHVGGDLRCGGYGD